MLIRLVQRHIWLYSISCFCVGNSLLFPQSAVARDYVLPTEVVVLPELPSTSTSADEMQSVSTVNHTSTDYILGPGDELSIAVIGYPEFDGTHRILPDGTISLPLVGTVQAGGKTLDLLAQSIKGELGSAYLVNPVVDLSLLTLRPISVSVSGEVYRPGPFQLDSLQDNGSGPTLVSALLEAGGVTRLADIREIVVKRRQMNGLTETITLNFWDALVSEPTAINLVLRDGDSIIVPRLSSNERLDRALIARSTIAPSTVKVKVVGEVTNPGEVEISPASSLSSAIATAGGPTDDARLSEVAFIRVDETDTVTSEVLDLRTLTDDIQVQEGDVIIVPKRSVATGLDFLARLANPFRIFTDIFRLVD